MAYIRYPQIMERGVIRNLLVTNKMSIRAAARRLGAPYKCVQNQAKKVLTVKEYAKIKRERIRLNKTDRMFLGKQARRLESAEFRSYAKTSGVSVEVLRRCVKMYKEWLRERKRQRAEEERKQAKLKESQLRESFEKVKRIKSR